MNSNYEAAWNALLSAIGTAQGCDSPGILELDGLTVEQKLKAAEVAALLSISSELSRLHPDEQP